MPILILAFVLSACLLAVCIMGAVYCYKVKANVSAAIYAAGAFCNMVTIFGILT